MTQDENRISDLIDAGLHERSAIDRAKYELYLRQQAAIEEAADKYGFRVPYDGSKDFYDEVAIKHFTKGMQEVIEHPERYGLITQDKALQSYSDQQNAELSEQLASEIESREHWQRQARRYQKYHRELNAALERAKELEAENARYRDRIGEALKFLQSRQQTTPGLGAPVTILKQVLEK